MTTDRGTKKGEKGMTLVEVLFALLILTFISLATLELFSLSVAQSLGAYSRTDLSYRAERVVEAVRLQAALAQRDPATNNADCCPLAATGTPNVLPVTDNCSAFWGDNGAGVWQPGAPFTLSYTVTPGALGRVVTVEAVPNSGGSRYIGSVSSAKAVRYVAQIQ